MAQNEKVIISVELRDKGVKTGLDAAAKASEINRCSKKT